MYEETDDGENAVQVQELEDVGGIEQSGKPTQCIMHNYRANRVQNQACLLCRDAADNRTKFNYLRP